MATPSASATPSFARQSASARSTCLDPRQHAHERHYRRHAAVDFATDRQMIEAALFNGRLVEPPAAKVVWIAKRSELTEIECSAAISRAAGSRDGVEAISPLRDWPFDAAGNLPPQACTRWPRWADVKSEPRQSVVIFVACRFQADRRISPTINSLCLV